MNSRLHFARNLPKRILILNQLMALPPSIQTPKALNRDKYRPKPFSLIRIWPIFFRFLSSRSLLQAHVSLSSVKYGPGKKSRIYFSQVCPSIRNVGALFQSGKTYWTSMHSFKIICLTLNPLIYRLPTSYIFIWTWGEESWRETLYFVLWGTRVPYKFAFEGSSAQK
jgi:hypothetical protein